MARIFTIESIEGNSNLGNPVFSKFGKMQNYQYIALSPAKEDRLPGVAKNQEEQPLDKENMQFMIKKPLDTSGLMNKGVTGKNATEVMAINERRK